MLEVACFNSESALKAAETGADRIELCAEYSKGGVTPSLKTLLSIKERYPGVPVNIMIRPRAGDFIYSDIEFEQMKSEIQLFKPHASGFVFGILKAGDHVDVDRNSKLVELAELPCTFHRAFDQISDKDKAVEELLDCGFKSILTSGGGKDALSGADVIAKLHHNYGTKIDIIAGGGVRSYNSKELKEKTGAMWFHSAAITSTGSEDVDIEEVIRMKAFL